MNWPEVCSTLEHMAGMPNNWDGRGALPVKRQVIDRAKDVIVWLIAVKANPPSRICPHVDGKVILSWDTEGINYEVCTSDDCLLEFGFNLEKGT
jgi:hypothetical protein